MILTSWKTVAIPALAAFAAAPACADVLEVGADGPRWISGPLVIEESLELAELPDGELSVPAEAVADAGLNARHVPGEYAAKVAELSARFDLSPALIEALVWQESRWQPRAVSPVGARGLAQLMPGTAREMGVDADDPFANLEGGARYLRAQLDRFDGDLEKALAAYNAGPGRVERSGGVPEIRETKTYVAAVMGRLASHTRSPE